MSLKLNFKGEILNVGHRQAGENYSLTYHTFDSLGICCSFENGNITLNAITGGGLQDLQDYQVSNTALLPYVASFNFDSALPKGFERQVGRYKFGTAAGRVTIENNGTYHMYIGSSSLEDLKTLALKIEDGEIWPSKVPQKVHIDAFKFYRKTYGVPAVFCFIAGLLTWLTVAVMKDETYLHHLQNHNMAQVMMVHSMWGIIVTLLCAGWFSYLFAKDIRPMLRITLSIIGYTGLLFFAGCFYYMMFTS